MVSLSLSLSLSLSVCLSVCLSLLWRMALAMGGGRERGEEGEGVRRVLELVYSKSDASWSGFIQI